MDQAVAGLIGVFVGGAVSETSQWLRMKAEARRADAQRTARSRGAVRMVAAELATALLRAKTDRRGSPRMPTQAWDRYGPDISAELPLDVVDPVQVAYFAIDNFAKGATTATGETLTDQDVAILERSNNPQDRRALAEWRANEQRLLDSLISAVDKGHQALLPYAQ